jgi:phosphinothricin acetyltransferase
MNSNATLATQPVTVAERREWLERFSAAGPCRLLVARRGSQVLGYAASQPYREHAGFRETVEVSIALDVTSRGQGAGTALYRALLGYLPPSRRRIFCARSPAALRPWRTEPGAPA